MPVSSSYNAICEDGLKLDAPGHAEEGSLVEVFRQECLAGQAHKALGREINAMLDIQRPNRLQGIGPVQVKIPQEARADSDLRPEKVGITELVTIHQRQDLRLPRSVQSECHLHRVRQRSVIIRLYADGDVILALF